METSQPGSHPDTPAGAPPGPPAGELSIDQGHVHLLGALAYGQLTGHIRLLGDAEQAPSLHTKMALARLGAAHFARFEQLAASMTRAGVDPESAMTPFVDILEEYHRRTAPGDWIEGLVKAYVGAGLSADFAEELRGRLDEAARSVIGPALIEDPVENELLATTIREAIARTPEVTGRLALYSRRLAGEAMSQVQRVAGHFPQLTSLIVAGQGSGSDLSGVSQMATRLVIRHNERMAGLNLSS